jgi:ATP-dependent DNA ligase
VVNSSTPILVNPSAPFDSLEGIVSKRADAPYRSGKSGWIKFKTKAWREVNQDRGLFNP